LVQISFFILKIISPSGLLFASIKLDFFELAKTVEKREKIHLIFIIFSHQVGQPEDSEKNLGQLVLATLQL
jgi:hypothetical protein